LVGLSEKLESLRKQSGWSRDEGLLDIEEMLEKLQQSVLQEYSLDLARARTDQEARKRVRRYVLTRLAEENMEERDRLADQLTNELVGYGPIEPFLQDRTINEIMVNGPDTIYVEQEGRLVLTDVTFKSTEHLLGVIQRIVAPLGRRVDAAQPFVDARLVDGSRVHVIIPPLAIDYPVLTIRKFAKRELGVQDLLELGTLNEEMVRFLRYAVRARLNIIVSGSTGSGKTSTLNVLSSFIENERVVSIEDAAELRLGQAHVIRLEARNANTEGLGSICVRELLRNALRMRPDRIIIGEVRGKEAYDLIQALNTGHEGSLSTVHANSAIDALYRLENMALTAGEGIPHGVMREQVLGAVDLVIHQQRDSYGQRYIKEIAIVNKGRQGSIVFSVFKKVPKENRWEKNRDLNWPEEIVERFIQKGLEDYVFSFNV